MKCPGFFKPKHFCGPLGQSGVTHSCGASQFSVDSIAFTDGKTLSENVQPWLMIDISCWLRSLWLQGFFGFNTLSQTYTKKPKSVICCLEAFHTTKPCYHSSPSRLQFFSLINIWVCEQFGGGMLLMQAKISRKDQRLWTPDDRYFKMMGLSVGVLHFRISKVATSSPQKRKHYIVFSFLNLGWSLTCCKPKTNPQKWFGLCRNNWGKKEGNHTVYLNWHLVQISTFY